MEQRLYIEYRVYFSPDTNQELLREVAEQAQGEIYDLFEGRIEETSGPLPSPHDVTFELVMEVKNHD